MALRVAIGFCVFGAGWFALDRYVPDLLPPIDAVGRFVALDHWLATKVFAIEGYGTRQERLESSPEKKTVGAVEQADTDKDSKDTIDGGLEANKQPGTASDYEKYSADKEGSGLEPNQSSESVAAVEQAEGEQTLSDIEFEASRQLETANVVEPAENKEHSSSAGTRDSAHGSGQECESIETVQQVEDVNGKGDVGLEANRQPESGSAAEQAVNKEDRGIADRKGSERQTSRASASSGTVNLAGDKDKDLGLEASEVAEAVNVIEPVNANKKEDSTGTNCNGFEMSRPSETVRTVEQAEDDKNLKEIGLEASRQPVSDSAVDETPNNDTHRADTNGIELESSRSPEATKNVKQADDDKDMDSEDAKYTTLESSRQPESASVVEQAANEEDCKDTRTIGAEVSRQPETVSTTVQADIDKDKDSADTKVFGMKAGRRSETMKFVEQATNDEDKDIKDTSGIKHDAIRRPPEILSSVKEAQEDATDGKPGSRTRGPYGNRVGDHEKGSFEHRKSTAEEEWKRIMNLLFEKIVDRVIPMDLRIIFRAAQKAARRARWPQWVSDVRYRNGCLLLSSAICIAFATWFWRSGTRKKNELDVPAADMAAAAPGNRMSCFEDPKAAHQYPQGCRHEGGYIYQKGELADQLTREDAAAVLIQNWVRTDFKRWLRERTPRQRSSIWTSPFKSETPIDEDHGAFMNTLLEDTVVSVDTLGPPESELCSKGGNDVASTKCRSEMEYQGSGNGDSGHVIQCRRGFSLTSANISKSLLKLKSHANPRLATKGQVPRPP